MAGFFKKSSTKGRKADAEKGQEQGQEIAQKIIQANTPDYSTYSDEELINERAVIREAGEDDSLIQSAINQRYKENPNGKIAQETNEYNASKKIPEEENPEEEIPEESSINEEDNQEVVEENPSSKLGVKLSETDDPEIKDVAAQVEDKTQGDEDAIVDEVDKTGLELSFFDENDKLKPRMSFKEYQKSMGKSTGDAITYFSVALALLTGGMTPVINGRNLPGKQDEYNAWCELYDYNKELYEDTQQKLLDAESTINQKDTLDTATKQEAERIKTLSKAQSFGNKAGDLDAETEDVVSGNADKKMQQELKQYALQMGINTDAQKNLASFQNDLQKDMYAAIQEMDHEQQKKVTEWASKNADVISKVKRGEMGISEAEHALNMTAKGAKIGTDAVSSILAAIIPG